MGRQDVTFGDFRLDLDQRVLTRSGEPVQIKGRPLELLCMLAAAGGKVVTKDTLMAQVWPGVVVEENNLAVQISALRRALGANGEAHVLTVSGRGYRLVGIGRFDPLARARPSV